MDSIKTAAVALVKDEADIICSALQALVDAGIGAIIVADNESSDATPALLHRFAKDAPIPVKVIKDSNPVHHQRQAISGMVELAVQTWGVEWLIPFDADEIWKIQPGMKLEDLCSLEEDVLFVPIYIYRPSLQDGLEEDPVKRMKLRWPEPEDQGKVCFRWRDDFKGVKHGNHGVLYSNSTWVASKNKAGCLLPLMGPVKIAHYPIRSWGQFVTKVSNIGRSYELEVGYLDEGNTSRRRWKLFREMGGEALRKEYDELLKNREQPQGLVMEEIPWG